MKILVRGVNWLGDAVMSIPALLQLRKAYPEAEIHLLTPSKLAGLWEHHPAVNHLHTLDPDQSPWKSGGLLRPKRFDLALIFPASFRAALETWFAAIPRRIGYTGQWRSFLLTDKVELKQARFRMRTRSRWEISRLIKKQPRSDALLPAPTSRHHAYHYLDLLAPLGIDSCLVEPSLFVTTSEQQSIWERFSLPKDRPVVALHPGAEYGPAKRWPLEDFAAAANEIQRQSQCHFVLLGNSSEVALTTAFTRLLSPSATVITTNTAGHTTLRDLCSLLRGCRVLISNDTGPMHVAAALGTPVVAIFGSTWPALTRPLPANAASVIIHYAGVQCSPCFRRECPIDFRCMKTINPEAVARSVLEILSPRVIR